MPADCFCVAPIFRKSADNCAELGAGENKACSPSNLCGEISTGLEDANYKQPKKRMFKFQFFYSKCVPSPNTPRFPPLDVRVIHKVIFQIY